MERFSAMVSLPFTEGDYDTGTWFSKIRGLEDEPEKGLRCEICIRERLRSTARLALEKGFDAFAAVLTVSPRKDVSMVNRLGEEAGSEFGIEYIPTDLKKRDGFKRSVELSREYGIYRQHYCGCEFSKRKNMGTRSQEPE
jgi:predicted adenine nucleotide alpha hydrolase (AANH) superfamily ATPase